MIVVQHSDNSPVISRGSKHHSFRSEDATDDESAGESDTSFEERSRGSAFQNRSSVILDDFSHVSSLANGRIGVIKHDSENYKWKVTMGKDESTGKSSFDTKSDRTEKPLNFITNFNEKRVIYLYE